MGLATKEKQCGGVRVRVLELPATRALTLLVKVMRVAGPALGVVADGVKSAKEDAKLSMRDMLNTKVQGDVIARAAAALFDRMDEGTVLAVVDELKAQSFININGKWLPMPDVFDLEMRSMRDMLAWLKFGLEVQFADFFDFGASQEAPASDAPASAPAA
jgi:hypothetical protein